LNSSSLVLQGKRVSLSQETGSKELQRKERDLEMRNEIIRSQSLLLLLLSFKAKNGDD
jgi:hypothetical protein